MIRGFSVSVLLTVLLLSVCPAEAQQPPKVARIGYLGLSVPSANVARIEAFRQGLRELGYVEGKNIVIEWRWAEGKADRIPDLATDLVRLKVDVIVTQGPAINRPAKEATSTIPIVMGFDNDPVGNGLVASLARPGGNVTGLSALSPELSGKQLELLKEMVPKLSRVAIFGNTKELANSRSVKEIEIAAGAFSVKPQYVDVKEPKELETAFGAAGKERADAAVILSNGVLNPYRRQVAEFAAKYRLPAIYNAVEWVEAGGLTSYGASIPDLFRRSAVYVDKILKGTKPADLPVEQPVKFEFIINLKAAKQIGLTIPPNVLARADKVIK
jgi:putative ABC transport system substrate-binding protein